jgi:hypothetical protein
MSTTALTALVTGIAGLVGSVAALGALFKHVNNPNAHQATAKPPEAKT